MAAEDCSPTKTEPETSTPVLVSPDKGRIQLGNKVVYDGRREIPVEERDVGMLMDLSTDPYVPTTRSLEPYLSRMRQADQALLGALAHTLKVSARGIGAWQVATAADMPLPADGEVWLLFAPERAVALPGREN